MTRPHAPIGDHGAGFRRFAGLVGRHVDLDLSGARPDSLLREELGFDSLAMAEVLVLLADLGVILPDDLVTELRTLGDLHHYVAVLAPAGGWVTDDPMDQGALAAGAAS